MTTLAGEVHHANVTPELTNWSVVFAPLFSKRVWSSVQVLLTGAILAVGTRTVTAVLRVMGLSQEEQFQKYYRVLNRAKWSSLAASRCLLRALFEAFVPNGPLLMALDDTIERRRGARIAAKGIYRDPVRSSHSHFVKASGLRWLCLMLLAVCRTWPMVMGNNGAEHSNGTAFRRGMAQKGMLSAARDSLHVFF